MDFSIDQPITRTYSTHLRYFQFAIQATLCHLITRIDSNSCSSTISSIGQPISIILLVFNAVALVILRCTKTYSRKIFIFALVVNVILTGVIMLFGLFGIGETNSCANNRVLHRFVGCEALIAIIVSGITLWSKYDFGVRYTNAPGNLAWVFLFFSFDWSITFKSFYIPIGVINLIITVANLSVHVVFLMSKFNANIKRVIYIVWFCSFLAMGIAECIGFFAYLIGSGSGQNLTDIVAKKLAQVFLVINIIDGLFWFYGLVGLKIGIGESIHEEAFGITEREERVDFC